MFTLDFAGTPVRISFHHLPPIRPHTIQIDGPERQKVVYKTKGARGHTVCYIKIGDGATRGGYIVSGESRIIPTDNLNKAHGRRIALAAALDQTDFDLEQRELIWVAYRRLSHA